MMKRPPLGSSVRLAFAKLCRARRASLGLTQEQVARAAETTARTYLRIEGGKSWPSGAVREALLRVLRVPHEDVEALGLRSRIERHPEFEKVNPAIREAILESAILNGSDLTDAQLGGFIRQRASDLQRAPKENASEVRRSTARKSDKKR